MTKKIAVSAFAVFIFLQISRAQISKSSELFLELKKQDSTLFELGFNQCNFEYLDKVMHQDLDFYHDQNGLQNRNTFFENTRRYICSNPKQKPIRKLEANSLEVFPLSKNGITYGAIQNGIHHFYLRENDKEDVLTSTAKFTSVWILENETWKMREVLSYDHRDSMAPNHKSLLEVLLQENNVPALGIGIIESGKLTKVEVYGTLDKKTIAPYNTIFKVASLTKPVVALITLKLIDKGLLELDEPLYKYWIDPDIKNDKRYKKLTPKIILTHQTGFPNWRWMNEEGRLAFQFDPGAEHQYSGEGFEYLRNAIENKLDKSLEELATELLFEPLNMSNTHFWWNEEMDETRYAQNFDIEGNQMETAKYFTANAAANLLTTVEDYGKFLAHVIDGAGLSKHLFEEMQKQQVKLKERSYFGLGWEILTEFNDDEFALLHSGRDPGVNTLAVLYPKSKNGYLIFLNGDNALPIFEELLTKKLYLGNELWNRR